MTRSRRFFARLIALGVAVGTLVAAGGSPAYAVADSNWSGWMANGGSYIAVQADFVIPVIGTCSNDAEVKAFIGLGGHYAGTDGYYRLIQVGILLDYDRVSGTKTYRAWYQYLKVNSSGVRVAGIDTTYLPVPVRGGDSVHLYTVIQTSTGKTTFYVHNNTTGQFSNPAPTISVSNFYDGRTAEFIDEFTPIAQLARFNALNWTNTRVQKSNASWYTLGSQPRLKTSIVDGGKTLATPDALSSSTRFTDRWLACT